MYQKDQDTIKNEHMNEYLWWSFGGKWLKSVQNKRTKQLNNQSYPDKRLGTLIFIRLRIWWARVSTRANLPSLLWGAPVNIDFKLSLSARQAISNELSDPTFPDCAEAMETDCPIRATNGISAVLRGPWPKRSAWTAARILGSEDTWSILLMTPTVLVATVSRKQILQLDNYKNLRKETESNTEPSYKKE